VSCTSALSSLWSLRSRRPSLRIPTSALRPPDLLSLLFCANVFSPRAQLLLLQYRNLFAEFGYAQDAIDAKFNAIIQDLFHGPKKVYFPFNDTDGTPLAYVTDVKNNDVRTEGMSYGLMVAAQIKDQDMFDRIWRWAVKYMQHRDGSARDGYTHLPVHPSPLTCLPLTSSTPFAAGTSRGAAARTGSATRRARRRTASCTS
jgi:hypothetical protein